VTGVAAATAAVETLLPAAAGFVLGDGARPGFGGLAAAGFVITVAATLVLVRSAGTVRECPEMPPEPPIPDICSSSLRRSAPLLPM
jgi:hypothetical protein